MSADTMTRCEPPTREAELRAMAGSWVDVVHPDGSEFEAQVLCAVADGLDVYLDLRPMRCGYERYARELKHVAPAHAATDGDPFWQRAVELNEAHRRFLADLEALVRRTPPSIGFEAKEAVYQYDEHDTGRTSIRTSATDVCPLVAVANDRSPIRFGAGDHMAAGVCLGLRGRDTLAIVEAADGLHLLDEGWRTVDYWYGRKLRRELERACGVAS